MNPNVQRALLGSYKKDDFSPLDIPNCALWLDASDASTITEVGGVVSQWRDKSTFSDHANQSNSGRRPITGANTINGLNVLDMNSKVMIVSNLDNLTNSNFTLIVVHQVVSAVPDVWLLGTNGPRGIFYDILAGTDVLTSVVNTGTDYTGGATISSEVDFMPHVAISRKIGSGAGSLQIIQDGVSGTYGKSSNTTASNWYIGAFTDTTSGSYIRVAEVNAFYRDLSNFELNKLGDYYKNKWGITWTNI